MEALVINMKEGKTVFKSLVLILTQWPSSLCNGLGGSAGSGQSPFSWVVIELVARRSLHRGEVSGNAKEQWLIVSHWWTEIEKSAEKIHR